MMEFVFQRTLLRNRFNDDALPPPNIIEDYRDEYKSHRPMPYLHFLGVLGLMLVVFSLVIIIEKQLPVGLKVVDETSYPDSFIAERAYRILKNLTDFGPRTAGSYENEVLAVNILKREIETIIKEANPKNKIELDVQKASGAFNLEFLDGMTNVYTDVQNVVVKISSNKESKNSLLLNCHFDSVVDSPGKIIHLIQYK